MTDEDRRAFENLILLCLPHAEEIDLAVLADRYSATDLGRWKAVQLETAPSERLSIPDGLVDRAVLLSMGDVLMDFREATIDLGGQAAQAPGAGGSGGGAIGPGASGGDGGPGGMRSEFTVTGAQVLGEIPIDVGAGGRAGVAGMPGERGGHSRFGSIVIPGGGRQMHSQVPKHLGAVARTSVAAAVFANYIEVSNGLAYLSGAGWSTYSVIELPAPFTGALCVWVDVSWAEADQAIEIPMETIAELITPTGTATFSEKSEMILMVERPTGLVRQPILFGLAGTLHDEGRHTLRVSCNGDAPVEQYLEIVIKR